MMKKAILVAAAVSSLIAAVVSAIVRHNKRRAY